MIMVLKYPVYYKISAYVGERRETEENFYAKV